MLLLFWIGSFWRDPDADAARESGKCAASRRATPSRFGLAGYAVATLAIVGAWPAYAAYLDRDETGAVGPHPGSTRTCRRLGCRFAADDRLAAALRPGLGDAFPGLSQGRPRGSASSGLLPASASRAVSS